jgi:8-oxo-dGTP pyrophosphatase MutT (NUDIX family)
MKARASADWRFAPATVFAHVRARLTLTPARDWPQSDPRLRPAAVLIGLAAYPDEVRIILTQRTAALRVHSGQIAFPGGKIDVQDKNAATAALREAQEEIGLDPRHVEPLGYLDPHTTGTGFRILPVVAKSPRRSSSRSIQTKWTKPSRCLSPFSLIPPITRCTIRRSKENFAISMRCPMARGTFGA